MIFLLWVLVFVTIVSFLWGFLNDIYVFFLAPRMGYLSDLKKIGGEWAVVTGAGAGIGRGYALALAAKGVSLCLIGKTESKLNAVSEKIKKEYGVNTIVIVHDFSVVQYDDAQKLKSAIGNEFEKIGILVNNVGIMGGDENFIIPFSKNIPSPIDYSRKMVNINIQSILLMTGLLLPVFVQRKRGIIVNLSSSCAIRPFYGHAVYSSTKSFIDFFSECVRQETKESNVIVQTVFPFFVRTALIPRVAFDTFPNLLAPDGDTFGQAAINTIGLQERTSGCFSHNIQYHMVHLLDRTLPKCIVDKIQSGVAILIRRMNCNYIQHLKKDM